MKNRILNAQIFFVFLRYFIAIYMEPYGAAHGSLHFFGRIRRSIPSYVNLPAEPAFVETLRAGRQVLWQTGASEGYPFRIHPRLKPWSSAKADKSGSPNCLIVDCIFLPRANTAGSKSEI